jgi:hypothetical protein
LESCQQHIAKCAHRSQALLWLVRLISDAMRTLAEDVRDELADSYPEELNRTPLRDIRVTRPDPRERSRLRSLIVRKFAHLTPMERYERAQYNATLLPGALRMLDLMLTEHLAALYQAAHDVRSHMTFKHGCCGAMCKLAGLLLTMTSTHVNYLQKSQSRSTQNPLPSCS